MGCLLLRLRAQALHSYDVTRIPGRKGTNVFPRVNTLLKGPWNEFYVGINNFRIEFYQTHSGLKMRVETQKPAFRKTNLKT